MDGIESNGGGSGMKKEELRTAIQEMNTYQFGQKKELTNKLSKVTSYVAKQEVLDMVSKLDKQIEEVKPALPVIPQFVADFIESKRDSLSLYGFFNSINNACATDVSWTEWRSHVTGSDSSKVIQETLARAWLDGYTIEKEQLHCIILPGFGESEYSKLYLGLNKDGKLDTSFTKPHITWGWKCEFTEQEIKAIDERYWAFAEEVTE